MTTYNPIKTGDTAPAGRLQLVDRDGNGADLTGATVVAHIPGEDPIAVTIVTAATGIVRCPRGDLAPPSGDDHYDFEIEFEVTYANSEIQTFPENGSDVLPVYRELDDAL